MTEPLLLERERSTLRDLIQLLGEGSARAPAIEQRFKSRMEAVEKAFQDRRQTVARRQAQEQEAADKEVAETRARITAEFDAEHAATQKEIADTRARITREYSGQRHQARSEFQEARWTIQAVLDANKNRAEGEFKTAQERIADQRRKMQSLQREANKVADAWWKEGPDGEIAAEGPALPEGQRPRNVAQCLVMAAGQVDELTSDILPRFFKQRRFVWLGALVWLLIFTPLAFLTEWPYWLAVSGCGGMLIGVMGEAWLRGRTRQQVFQIYQPLCQTLALAATLCTRALHRIKKKYRRDLARSKKKHNRALRKAQAKYQKTRAASRQQRDTVWHQAEEELRQRWAGIRQRRDTDWLTAEEKYQHLRLESQQRYETDWQAVHDDYFRQLEENKKSHDADWQALFASWLAGMEKAAAAVTEINQQGDWLFPPWEADSWTAWKPPTVIPPGIRFGEFEVILDEVGPGLPADERLREVSLPGFTLPACLSFPDRCSLLYTTDEEGRAAAVASLQAVMLRFLTSLPPGKVRFTIIDPVGLGQNFAAFMHLADYDEQLVASRIWTELPHIEQRLADLTGHMENVIQKYLRNQFETIEEYNAHAGEVAEPYRVLVVANFPANFSSEAARRLVSIAASGARCGVYTLITVDTRQPLPQGFNLADLMQPSVNLVWNEGRFIWKDRDFEKYPLSLEEPPSADFCTQMMHQVGAKARDANRVEVAFEFIAPSAERWWTGDSRSGIDVPLGRAGATKRQHLQLGQGTSHHVLIAGKTGSGKSTLLHALITNLALCYSPDELELYLVDFKKGVEFKTYAAHELPHARVVAVESEREFGLSVLQRLDAELKQRGDRFREAGAQNLAAYRDANGKALAPRIMLIVDEFQEFFIEDDKIAQESAQLLDRLVRQGRAFGLHVLLGSQTLGGAYTLARSTIDQMAVRIALQCSEADGHIILSDDNSAARLLSRPGEAIYNDANGLVEGNNPFQVVWLSDEDREVYLKKVHDLDRAHGRRPQIVFEGNAPADAANNHLLSELLHNPAAVCARRGAHAWLGEAMAIKDPTAAVFRPQSASNLLIVGQHEESSLGMLTTALISLAAQDRTGAARFVVLDGSLDDSPFAGFLGRFSEVVPQGVRCADWRDLAGVMSELSDEVERRQKGNEAGAPPVYLLIHGLQRFRDLRRQDDDFSFARRGEDKPNPARQLVTILREGPALGMHTLIWCDSLNNVNRCLDRQGMREFEMRVLFQMSATDSSVLIDSPAAGKLGLHRALYHSEDQGRLEKFRPYGLPAETWLAEVGRLLRAARVAVGV